MTLETQNGHCEEHLPLEIDHMSITLGHGAGLRVVDEFSLSVRKGEIVGLVGESGSGKSVTCLAAMGLLSEEWQIDGHIQIANTHIDRTTDRKDLLSLRGRGAAMVFQDANASLNPIQKVGKQLTDTVARLRGVSRSQARETALDLLRQVEMPDPEERFHSYPFQLSGGQNQRVMIALALAGKPELLFADEPTTALDVTVQSQILNLIRKLRDETGMGVVFVTHDLGVVSELCDTVAVMYKGKLLERGSVEQIMTNPQNDYTRKLLAAMPTLPHDDPDPSTPLQSKITGEALLRLRNVACDYKTRKGTFRAVEDVSLALRTGDSLAVIGESGSGKSTISKLMLGIEPPSEGSALFEGEPVPLLGTREYKPFARKVQLVPQNPYLSLDPRATLGDQIEEPFVIHGIGSPAERFARRNELLEAVQLTPAHGERYPHEVSGGQCQRAVIARALALEPKLLICDEATASLDVSVQARIIELLQDLQEQFHLSLVFVTHDLRLIHGLCNRVAVMCKGELVELNRTEAMFANPRHPYTRELLAAIPDVLSQSAAE